MRLRVWLCPKCKSEGVVLTFLHGIFCTWCRYQHRF